MIAGGLLVPAAVFGQIVGGVVDSKRSKSLNQTASFTKWIGTKSFHTELDVMHRAVVLKRVQSYV